MAVSWTGFTGLSRPGLSRPSSAPRGGVPRLLLDCSIGFRAVRNFLDANVVLFGSLRFLAPSKRELLLHLARTCPLIGLRRRHGESHAIAAKTCDGLRSPRGGYPRCDRI